MKKEKRNEKMKKEKQLEEDICKTYDLQRISVQNIERICSN